MATSNDVIRRAMRVAKILATGQTPSGEDYADGLSILNSMLAYWASDGIDLQCPLLGSATTLPVDEDKIQGIVYNLAVMMAPEYGEQIDPTVAKIAADAIARMRADLVVLPEASFDLPESEANRTYNIRTG